MHTIRLTLLALTAATALAACGGASSTGKGPHSEARTTAFKKMMPNFSEMGKMVKGETAYDVEKFKTAAAAFAIESEEPFKHFTSDGEGQDGDALPNIWTEQSKFQAEQDKFRAAVTELNSKAQGGNLAEIKVAYGAVGASCKSCHDSFRKPK